LDELMSKKCGSAARPAKVPAGGMSRSSCYDMVSMLEQQLRTARALLDELTQQPTPVAQTSAVVLDYCAKLRAEAVEVVKATEMLQDEVCGPAASMKKQMTAHAEVGALLERIKTFWAELPQTLPNSKRHKALVDKIHVASAAYLKIADAARGVDRKAAARAIAPAG
jgi:hypothetical protein